MASPTKRGSSSSSTGSPNKKRRATPVQSSIDTFFSSPTKSKTLAGFSGQRKPTTSKEVEVIDVDLLDSDTETPKLPSPRKPTPSASKPLPVISLSSTLSSRTAPPYESLLQDAADFNPDPALFLKDTTGVDFSLLANTLAQVRQTRSRIAIINGLTNFFRVVASHHPPSLVPAVYLLSNTLAPPFRPVELGLGPSTLSQSIQQVSGLTSAALRKLYTKLGDPGDVAFEAKSNVRTLMPHAALTISGVYSTMLKIAGCQGQGALKKRQNLVEKLLVSSQAEETRFLVRILSQNLRVGAVRTSILTALGRAAVLAPPSHLISSEELAWYASKSLLRDTQKGRQGARNELNSRFKKADSLLRRIYAIHPDYDHVVSALVTAGLSCLSERLPLTVGIPVQPTLGTPARSLSEIYDKFGQLEFSAELKYDGQRAQIHVLKQGDQLEVGIFSRHLEDMTTKYPDIVATMKRIFDASPGLESVILDCEIVAVDSVTGEIKSFQELSGRARKDVDINNVAIPVSVFVFDLMFLNGKNLLDADLRARRALIAQDLPLISLPGKGYAAFARVESCDSTAGHVALESFWMSAVNGRSEGLMVKLLDSEFNDNPSLPLKKLSARYNVDQRTYSWIKLKKDYVDGIGDTLDVIPIGAWHGNGRKNQWWSPLLLALWDPEMGRPVAVCKCMSGFSDEFYKDLNKRYSLDIPESCSRQSLWDCELGGFRPDVYFNPQEVWEIRGADITISPVSLAAMGMVIGHQRKGLSVRFPRFLRAYPDKPVHGATIPSFLSAMYQKQSGLAIGVNGNDDDGLGDPDLSEDEAMESDASL